MTFAPVASAPIVDVERRFALAGGCVPELPPSTASVVKPLCTGY
ncbi:MAG TPA: hypothetical protein VMD91_16290 [Candidatus Sulfotelmatobacter sp.]|nr:hypothetical protein [Candidatus Sulfotelmatobacter sp.]